MKTLAQMDKFMQWLSKNLPPIQKPAGPWDFIKPEYRPKR